MPDSPSWAVPGESMSTVTPSGVRMRVHSTGMRTVPGLTEEHIDQILSHRHPEPTEELPGSQHPTARQHLARDLRVHPLARVVEGDGTEAGEQERHRHRDRQHGGGHGRSPPAQVRDTRKTPSTMKPMPVHRAAVTGSARNI